VYVNSINQLLTYMQSPTRNFHRIFNLQR